MSIIPASFIKNYAEVIGITNLSEEVADFLCQQVEFRARELLQDASKFMEHSRRTRLNASDLNNSLLLHNEEPLYGYDTGESLNFKTVPNSNIFYIPKEEIDLETFVQQPIPKAPQPLTLTSHWLAIDGIQPTIPENPNLHDPSSIDATSILKDSVVPKREGLQEDAEVKPLVKHVLSKEMQSYYDTIIADLLSSDGSKVKAALYSLSSDSGLQQLLPYFVQFVAEMVPKNLKTLPILQTLTAIIAHLISNENLFIEPYLHQVMPPLLACLLGKRLCEDPEKEDHWSLRDHCANIISELCRKFGNIYSTLVPRVTKTFIKTFLDHSKPYASHYGALVGISKFGPHAIEALLLPNLEAYLNALTGAADESVGERGTPADISKLTAALKESCNKWLSEAYSPNNTNHPTYRQLIQDRLGI